MRKVRTWIQGHLTALFNEWSGAPEILRNRVCCLAGLALVIFSVGVYAGIRYHARDFFVLSGCLSLAVIWKLYGLVIVVLKRNYCAVEGTVLKAQSRYKPGRFYRVTLLRENQTTEIMLLDKNWRVEEGGTYRFFFQPGIGKLGAYLNTDRFLGVEKTDKKYDNNM